MSAYFTVKYKHSKCFGAEFQVASLNVTQKIIRFAKCMALSCFQNRINVIY